MNALAADRARFDLTLMRLRPRTMPMALDRLKTWLDGHASTGKLLACLYSDIGTVNQLLLLRGFDDAGLLLTERDAILREPDPFGASEFTLGLTTIMMAALPGVPAPEASSRGGLFEVRSDIPRPSRLAHALQAWTGSKPRSLPLCGFYTLAADAPRIVHFWPLFPPDGNDAPVPVESATDLGNHLGGPANLVSQRAEIFRAAAFSPLR